MKNIITLVFLIFFYSNVLCQLTNYPEYNNRTNPRLYIESVEVLINYTIIKCKYTNDGSGYMDKYSFTRFWISKESFLKSNNKKFILLKADNVEFSDNGINNIPKNGSKYFTLYFEPLIKGIESFDLIENETRSSAFNFYGVKINNPFESDRTPPKIIIIQPDISRGFKPIEQEKQITITGKVTDESGIFEVLINGQEANVDAQGDFSKVVLLAIGDNSFTVKATDLKQNTTTETFIIERKSIQQDVVVVNNQTNNSGNLQTGKYYALIIGNNNYQDAAISALNEPINDATKLYTVLTTEYSFEPQNVTFLKNASYVQMIEAFDNLSSKITPNDNLLVFYAGHGWWNETKNLGYWLPCDAKKSNTAFWIPNSRISDYMSSIHSKHTLLISDACFSGSIFKTRSAFADAQPAINKLYELPSKKAMTSGNLKEVPDRSVFLQFLVKRLQDNKEKYISSDMLFASFRQAVLNNSPNEPQYGTIQNAGDEGGEFIFIRRDK